MRSIKTTVTAAAILAAGFVLTAPAAHAATVPHAWNACSAADAAEHECKVAVEDSEGQSSSGDSGTAEDQNAIDMKGASDSASSTGSRAWMGMGEDGDHHEDGHHHHRHCRHPHGAMHTGVGSTSRGVNGGEITGGLGILGVAGAGALALRRRRASIES